MISDDQDKIGTEPATSGGRAKERLGIVGPILAAMIAVGVFIQQLGGHPPISSAIAQPASTSAVFQEPSEHVVYSCEQLAFLVADSGSARPVHCHIQNQGYATCGDLDEITANLGRFLPSGEFQGFCQFAPHPLSL